jgi:hypothetical protein
MPCVNHPGADVQSYCQNCGKALCAQCVRTTAKNQVLCESCFAATGGDPSQGYWQGAGVPPGQVPPFIPMPPSGPNPSVAAVLGLIPGVGAMYNGQLFKGLIHVVIFAILISITDHYPVFGIFIGAWVLYQSFEAFHTAKARRDGLPVPDPFGLNELGSWMNMGSWGKTQDIPPGVPPGVNPPPPPAGVYPPQEPPPYSASYASSWSGTGPGSWSGSGPGQVPPQPTYTEPYAGPNPEAYPEGFPPGAIPPVPPQYWRRREPIFAFVLIGLGILFLLKSFGFAAHLLHYIWPLMLIGLGVWLIMRRIGYTQGGSK